ncbi:MAG: GspE/PulE family protein [Magnetococcus sp. DMHC-8]
MLPVRHRLGDRLVEGGELTPQQLQTALAAQERTGAPLGAVLIQLGMMEEQQFLQFLSGELRVPLIDLGTFRIDTTLTHLLPEAMARRHQALVLARMANGLLVGMVDPTDIFACDELVRTLGGMPRLALVGPGQLSVALDFAYRGVERIQEQAAALGEEMGRAACHLEGMPQTEPVLDAPVVHILQALFEEAVRCNASDIHIEPDLDVLRLRRRIDGVLHEQVIQERLIAPALVSKLKLMAGLEIAERRLPQDGRFDMVVKGRTIDVRVSTLPVQDGESVVLRLLDRSREHAGLHTVLEPDMLQRFQKIINRLHGLVLVTGPTGSGKTTTLYGALHLLNRPETKIITVEDPVEYRLPRISQVQINPRIGLTFSSILRTVLRQDPDIILVGEMRDRETADMAIRAALTGHLVFSTLHTNSAIEAAVRLLEMGLEGYAVAAALQCILAQRLIRRVCMACRESMAPALSEATVLRHWVGEQAGQLVRGRGCSQCHFTGFAGRMAVVEMLELRGEMADALRRHDLTGLVEAARQQEGYLPLHRSAMSHALQGRTTLEEALRLAEGEEQDRRRGQSGVDGLGARGWC